MANIDWELIRAKLPLGKTDYERETRENLFKLFDPNGNGYLSLAEVDKGYVLFILIINVLIFRFKELGMFDVFDAKPVLLRAFNAAKGANSAKSKSKVGDDYVEFLEFRLLLVYVRQYFEIWQMFDQVDTSDDRRVDFEEFKKALPLIESWGVKISDPRKEFDNIDRDHGGKILFEEFSDWALKKNLDLVEDDD